MKIDHTFTIQKTDDGKFAFATPQVKQHYEGFVYQMEVGKDYYLTIREKKDIRTKRQNAWYRLYLQGLEKQGYGDEEALHDDFKKMFLCGIECEIFNGRKVIIYPTTTQLSKKEFSEYIKKIEVYTGVLAPDTSLFGLEE